MLNRLKQTLRGQLLIMLVCGVLSFAVSYYFGYRPLLRASVSTLFRGVTGGLLLLVLRAAVNGIIFLLPFERGRRSLEDRAQNTRKLSGYSLAGAVLVSALGEELFLRGYLFGAFSSTYFWQALAGTTLLTVILYADRSLDWPQLVVRGVDALFLALLFQHHRSLALIAAARLVADLASALFLRLTRTGKVLAVRRPDSQVLYWRQLYAASISS